VLEQLGEVYGLPPDGTLETSHGFFVMYYGPGFLSIALSTWAEGQGISLDNIDPGEPVQDCFAESSNGTFRGECLSRGEQVRGAGRDRKRSILAKVSDLLYRLVRSPDSLGLLDPNYLTSDWVFRATSRARLCRRRRGRRRMSAAARTSRRGAVGRSEHEELGYSGMTARWLQWDSR
jgi:putative transposase